MKKIILSIFIICSVTNILYSMEMNNNNNNNNRNNNNNNIECPELPKEIWMRIALALINFKKITESNTLPTLKETLQEINCYLGNFAKLSKSHYEIVKYILNKTHNLDDQTVKLKECYGQKETAILKEIKELFKNILLDNENSCSSFNNINGNNDYNWPILIHAVVNSVANATNKAVANKYVHIVQFLIQNGTNINVKDSENQTALILACKFALCDENEKKAKEIVELLINNKANLNIQDLEGWTALMWAAYYGNKNIVELLINNEANINIINNNGDTAFNIALNRGYNEIAVILSTTDLNSNPLERPCIIQ